MGRAVETFRMTKRFDDFTAVDHLDLETNHKLFDLLAPVYRVRADVLTPLVLTAILVAITARLDQRVM